MKLKLTYFFTIIAAIVLGHFLGVMCSGTGEELIQWLGTTLDFGFPPTSFNFAAMSLTLGVSFSVNFLQILFVLLAVVLSPKIASAIK
ncbi:MAG TPA: hypothetical protein DCG49_11710 [Ruminococcus sp.]|nr:hypothetical protein [Ruminococcus sp.]